jgi:transposase
MEQMRYHLLFRWFVGLGIDCSVWVPTVFTRNRNRLLTTKMSRRCCRPTIYRSMAR